MSSRRAWCQSRLNSSCSRASSSVRLNISLRRWTPRTVCTARLGRPLSHAVHGSKALLVNQGERLVSENLGPTSLQALSLLRRHQELGLPEALLRVSYSEHPPLPRPGAAPTTFYYIIPTLPQAGEGFFTNKSSHGPHIQASLVAEDEGLAVYPPVMNQTGKADGSPGKQDRDTSDHIVDHLPPVQSTDGVGPGIPIDFPGPSPTHQGSRSASLGEMNTGS